MSALACIWTLYLCHRNPATLPLDHDSPWDQNSTQNKSHLHNQIKLKTFVFNSRLSNNWKTVLYLCTLPSLTVWNLFQRHSLSTLITGCNSSDCYKNLYQKHITIMSLDVHITYSWNVGKNIVCFIVLIKLHVILKWKTYYNYVLYNDIYIT